MDTDKKNRETKFAQSAAMVGGLAVAILSAVLAYKGSGEMLSYQQRAAVGLLLAGMLFAAAGFLHLTEEIRKLKAGA